MSFAGSVVTFLKLQELITTRPIVFTGYPVLCGSGRCRRSASLW